MKKALFSVLFISAISNICLGASISVESFITPDDVTIEHLDSFRSTVVNAINSADGSLLQSSSVTASKLDANANPENFRDEAFNDFVYTGLLPVTSSGTLTTTTALGTAYVKGTRVVKDATQHAYTASKWTFVDLSNNGTFTYSEIAIGAAEPATATDSIRLARVSTDGTEVVAVRDDRVTTLTTIANSTKIIDTDNDTYIDTESSSDTDLLEHYVGGNKIGEYDANGINFAAGKGITDADGDTKIQLEESGDEDKVRIDVEGTETTVFGDGTNEPLVKITGNTAGFTQPLLSVLQDHATPNLNAISVQQDGTASCVYLNNTNNYSQLRFAGDPTIVAPVDGDFWYDGTTWKANDGTNSYTIDWTQISDKKAKQNIKSHKLKLSDLEKINIVEYNYKPGYSKDTEKKHIGFVSDDVKLIYPKAVKKFSEGLDYVDYKEFIPLLIASVQELSEKVKNLERRIEVLEWE